MVCLLCQLVCGTGRTTSKWSSTEVFVLSGWSGLVSGTGKMAGCREHPNSRKYFFFDWDHDGVSDHVGIVESCDGTTVYTVEGNSGDAVKENSYTVHSASIMGYGIVSGM